MSHFSCFRHPTFKSIKYLGISFNWNGDVDSNSSAGMLRPAARGGWRRHRRGLKAGLKGRFRPPTAAARILHLLQPRRRNPSISQQPRPFPSPESRSDRENRSADTMGVRDSHGEAAGTPDPVEKGFATLNTLK